MVPGRTADACVTQCALGGPVSRAEVKQQKGKLINRAAAARAWVALFERNANSWSEFEAMLARLTFAAITQKCLEARFDVFLVNVAFRAF